MNGFTKFLLRGNVVDLAVAVAVGAAFTAVVAAFSTAFIAPLLSLFGGAGSLGPRKFSLYGKPFPYGQFLEALISFVITAGILYFLVVLPVNRLMERFRTEPEVESTTKPCPECLSSIPIAATRCAFCSVVQPDAA